MSPYSADWLPAGWSLMPVEEHGLQGLPCVFHGCPWPQHPHPDPPCRGEIFQPQGIGTVFHRGSTTLAAGCLWVPCHATGLAVGWCLQVPRHGMGSTSWAVPCCGSLRLSCPIALSNMISFSLAHARAPFLCHFPRSFILPVAALRQARFCHQWVSQAFLLPSALAGCWHPPWLSSTLGIPTWVCCSPWLCLGSPQGNVPGGHGVFRKTGLGTC